MRLPNEASPAPLDAPSTSLTVVTMSVFVKASLLADVEQASVRHPLRWALFVGFGAVNERRTNRAKEL